MKKSNLINFFVVGFALFAVFFGAGNLIFPPAIGIASGSAWVPAIAGMSISAILLPILTIIAVNNMGSDLDDLAKPVAPWFTLAYMVFFILFVGCVGVPRQGGMAIEAGIFGLFPALSEIPYALTGGLLVYFAIVFFVAGKPNKIVDIVGKILTPLLLIILVFIAVAAFVTPIGVPGDTGLEQPFINAFLQGYQTGDVVVGIVIASIFISSIRELGYTERKAINAMTLKSSLIAFLALFVVYGGLLYLGATGTSIFEADMDQAALLNSLVNRLIGTVGVGALCISIFLACLTTSIGVVGSIASMTFKLAKEKIPYRIIVGCCCVIGVVIGTIGISSIIAYSYWCFFLIYPVSIVLTLMGVFRKFVPNHGAWKGAVLMATLIGLYDAIGIMNAMELISIQVGFLEPIYNAIPLSAQGMAWLIPSILGFIVGAAIVKFTGGDPYPMDSK